MTFVVIFALILLLAVTVIGSNIENEVVPLVEFESLNEPRYVPS